MDETIEVQCPWCHDRVEVVLGSMTFGERDEHCLLCGETFRLRVSRDDWGDPEVHVDRHG